MTWEANPIDVDQALPLFQGVQRYAAGILDTLAIAAERLAEAAGQFEPGGDCGTIQLAAEVKQMQLHLVDLCRLHKSVLPRETLALIREDFAFVGLDGEEHLDARREFVEKVMGRKVERMAELSLDEAALLRSEISKQLEKAF